nr:hypothetical protein [Tanacetum cinerariifolium]
MLLISSVSEPTECLNCK